MLRVLVTDNYYFSQKIPIFCPPYTDRPNSDTTIILLKADLNSLLRLLEISSCIFLPNDYKFSLNIFKFFKRWLFGIHIRNLKTRTGLTNLTPRFVPWRESRCFFKTSQVDTLKWSLTIYAHVSATRTLAIWKLLPISNSFKNRPPPATLTRRMYLPII